MAMPVRGHDHPSPGPKSGAPSEMHRHSSLVETSSEPEVMTRGMDEAADRGRTSSVGLPLSRLEHQSLSTAMTDTELEVAKFMLGLGSSTTVSGIEQFLITLLRMYHRRSQQSRSSYCFQRVDNQTSQPSH